jgi:hypothetical protein
VGVGEGVGVRAGVDVVAGMGMCARVCVPACGHVNMHVYLCVCASVGDRVDG